MEIIIGLLLVVAGIWYIFFKDLAKDTKTTPVTPQKEEVKPEVAPVVEAGPAKCGCGRSPTGFCVGLHKLSTDEWATHADNPNKVVVEAPKAPTKKPAAKKTAGAKPAAKKTAKTAKPKAAKKA